MHLPAQNALNTTAFLQPQDKEQYCFIASAAHGKGKGQNLAIFLFCTVGSRKAQAANVHFLP